MNSVNISFTTSKVFNGFDAMAVRCGYLLGEDVLLAGDIYLGVYAEEQYSGANDSLKTKLEYMILHLKDHPMEGITIEQLESALVTNKAYSKQKHKTPQQIIAEKKFERAITKIYEAVIASTIQVFELAGLSQLSHLVNNGIVLAPIHDKDRELEREKGVKGFVKLSTVLSDRFKDDNPNDIYLVTGQFGEYLKEHNYITAPFNSVADNKAKTLSAPLFKFPAVAQLKATELQSIRKGIYAVNEAFRNQMDEWSKALKTVDFTPAAFAAMQQTFETQIAPHIATIQQAIDADERIQFAHKANENAFELIVKLHVCSVSFFHQYLTSINVFGLETLKALATEPGYEKNSLTACMVLECAHSNLELKPVEAKTEERPVLTKRKTIDTD